ncbi:MAG TPA: hypothetical protein VFJ14_15660, partial [Nocardioidaceae bacterium]|nr:hypothetical protein [Nocardioidaceae bacterium]
GIITAGVPAFLLLVGWWEDTTAVTITLAVLGALLLTLAIPLGRILAAPTHPTPTTDPSTGAAPPALA